MSSSSPRWLELDRRFLPASEASLTGGSAALLAQLGNQLTWPDLLGDGCTVILGERGTGKTEELRARARLLLGGGKAAFFLPVEEVARRGVADSVHLDELASFRAWKAAAIDEAWFLLDSVDEASLRGYPLSSALTGFAHELEPDLRRVHLVISCRASDWRTCDEDEVRRLAPHLFAPDNKGTPQLVHLAPLDERQVGILAAHHGVEDVQAFLQAVRNSNSWSFVERPLDVEWLSGYWRINRKLGSLRELVGFNIQERLKEKPGRPTMLSTERVRDGARDLALAAILLQKAAFRLPENVPDPRADDSIDPRDVLPQWTNEEITELLSRGLFDEATYGRVRVHHRSVQEFLAAERLGLMVHDGLPRADLNALLFRASSGRVVVPRHLAPVVAWLAAADRDVRGQAMRIVPEQLIDEGDPAALPVAERRAMLSAYATKFGERKRIYHHFDSFGLKRFACTEIVGTTREMLGSKDEPEHIKETLLRIAKMGQIVELAGPALEIALAPETGPVLRDIAIEVAAMPGPDVARRHERLSALVAQHAARSPDTLATLLEELFPGNIDVGALVPALAAVSPMRESRITGLDVLVPRLPARCSAAERQAFLELLTAQIAGPPTKDDPNQPTIKQEHLWLADCLANLTAAVIDDGHPFPSALSTALSLLFYVNGYHDGTVRFSADRFLEEHTALKREMFWFRADALAAKKKRFPREWWDIELFGTAQPGEKDVGWLSEDAVTMPDVRRRLLAFACVVRVVGGTMQGDARVAFLERLAERSDTQNRTHAMMKRLRRLSNPPPILPHPAAIQMHLRQRVREIKQQALAERNRKALCASIERIRSGEAFNALVHLYSSCQRGRPGSRWASLSQGAITETYGFEIGVAAQEGFRRFWRSNAPARLEDAESNSTPYTSILGLVGLGLDVQAGLDVCGLSDPLLESAACYAGWELNGFPEWFPRLAGFRPDVIRAVFDASLHRDYLYVPPAENPEVGRILWKLPHAATEVRRACAPALAELMRAGDPPGLPALEATLEVLHSAGTLPKVEASALARDRAERASDDHPRFALWWCFWAVFDPQAAVEYLEVALKASAAPKQLAEEVCSRLWEGHDDGPSALRPTALRADGRALARLIPLIYGTVLPKDDIIHDGAFSPGKRDRSQDLRNALITWLSEIPGTETVDALDRLARDPSLADIRDWLLHLADVRASENAGTPMSVRDAREFIHSLVLEPRNTEELFTITQGRLDDIRTHLLHDDFSVRQAYSPPNGPITEEPVQNYIAHELEVHRRRQYTVVREPEVTRKKKPDIRVANPRCDGPVTIEVKIAERWTFAELGDALLNQLVGTYMKANDSRYGVLVVCSSGPVKTWEVSGGEPNIHFEQLLEKLRGLASVCPRADFGRFLSRWMNRSGPS